MLERMQYPIGGWCLPRWRTRAALRAWRDQWLVDMAYERDLLLMGRHKRQTEFYRDGNRPDQPKRLVGRNQKEA